MKLGERMKEYYEFQSRTSLLRRTPVIIRLDGKAFHTFTRGLDKPFDRDFIDIMQQTMLELCRNIQGCVLGYTQSDEITLVLIDYKELETSAWFDNEVQKMVSVSASMATLAFNMALSNKVKELEYNSEANMSILNEDTADNEGHINMQKLFLQVKIKRMQPILEERLNKLSNKLFRAMFDSRAFNIPKEEVCNNLIWRQQDATRNSINALAQSLFSHKSIQGISAKDLQNKMLVEKDVNWNDLPVNIKRGSCALRNENGGWVIDNEIPIFTENREYVNKRILYNEVSHGKDEV